ncbi:MAG: mechanosensitive ion channel family protein [Gemmataceae bacterium]
MPTLSFAVPTMMFAAWWSFPVLDVALWQWGGLVLIGVASFFGGLYLERWLLRLGLSLAQRTRATWNDHLLGTLRGPLRWVLTALLFYVLAALLGLEGAPREAINLLFRSLFIVLLVWVVLRLLSTTSEWIEGYLTRQVADANRQRAIRTQISVPRRIVRFVVILLGIALVLMQFDVVRSVGVSLIASAGLAGLIIGLAAQRTIANLLAGVQLAIFQPIKIGDVVIVENEWGWIEDISLTYVVVKIWDLRRLILPVSYFLERPFQNWTKDTSDLLGTVFLYADYTAPIDRIREELKRILAETPLWDQRAQGVVVTNLNERTVEIRALVSARDGGQLWDLRCLVREKLLLWLQTQGRDYLPIHRVEMLPAESASSANS